MKVKLQKIKSWIVRDDLNLTNYWWHRLLKVVFIIFSLLIAFYFINILFNSYSRIVNRWVYKDLLSTRLASPAYTGKIFSISELHDEREIISTLDQVYSKGGYSPSFSAREYLKPYSSLFVTNPPVQSFCSDKLSDNIKDIALKNNIRLFSEEDPRFDRLTSNIESFISYLNSNSFTMECVMIDSYSIANDDGSESRYSFLRPVNTFDYGVYKYEDGKLFLLLAILIGILAYIFSIFVILLAYYKVFLYIIFGSKKQ